MPRRRNEDRHKRDASLCAKIQLVVEERYRPKCTGLNANRDFTTETRRHGDKRKTKKEIFMGGALDQSPGFHAGKAAS
ncbi:MAG: hypothetical protein L0229_08230, partial [Blastocatellia bacterium]|nr:hypothetical protein [Blastocatellia bacterium]